MGTEWGEISEGSNKRLREELETAWLRGYRHAVVDGGADGFAMDDEDKAQAAADYAERVVGGSTRPERPVIGDV